MTDITDILPEKGDIIEKGSIEEVKDKPDLFRTNSYFDKNKGKFQKDIENLLLEKGFKREKRPDWDRRGVYLREINNKKEVFVYSDGDLILTKISKNKRVEEAFKKIKNYKDDDSCLIDKWVTPVLYFAPIVGSIIITGKVALANMGYDMNPNDDPNYIGILAQFFLSGGIIGTVLWRTYWSIHNKRFKEGNKAIEYIRNSGLVQCISKKEQKPIAPTIQPRPSYLSD